MKFKLGITSVIIWEFPKIWGTLLGVPILRILVYWGLYWGPPNFGKLPYELQSRLQVGESDWPCRGKRELENTFLRGIWTGRSMFLCGNVRITRA